MADPARLTTLSGLEQLYPVPGEPGKSLFPEATVRAWVAQDLDRFATMCVVRMGGKVLVDLDAIPQWLESRRGAASRRHRSTGPGEGAGRLVTPLKPFDEIWRKAGLPGRPPGARRGRRRVPSTSANSA